MRSGLIAAALAVLLAACGPDVTQKSAPSEEGSADSTLPTDDMAGGGPASMSRDRLALCVTAVEAWDQLGVGRPPGRLTAEEATARRNLLTMQRMEMEMESDTMGGELDTAVEAWKDKTPADIERAAAACLEEVVE